MTDALDHWKRQELAGSMLPCRELPPEEKARIASDAQARNAILASWYGRGETPVENGSGNVEKVAS
jgi:hypothetical protein